MFLWPSCPTSREEGGHGCHSGSSSTAFGISWHSQWFKCPAHEFTLALLGTVSSLWHWDICMACTISLSCFFMALLFPTSHCCCTCASPSLYPCPVCSCASSSVGCDLCLVLCPSLPLSPGMPSWHISAVRDALIQTPLPKISRLRFRLVPSEGQR